MHINSRNFFDGKTMRRQGEENPNPTAAQIRSGLVREVKIIQPAEGKKRVRKRKSNDTAEQGSQLD